MFEKTYRRKDKVSKAVQYDGTYECGEDLYNTYSGLYWDGSNLYLTADYSPEQILEGDWILVEGRNALEVKDRDYFADNYEEIKR